MAVGRDDRRMWRSSSAQLHRTSRPGTRHRQPGAVHRLIGCGVSVPGLVRELDDGVVVAAPNLGWVDVAAGRLARSRTRPRRFRSRVGNDADLGALAESRFGAGVGCDHMIFVSGEVGVGGGLVAAGRPVVGHLGFAGEIGHLPVNPDWSPLPVRVDRLLGDRGR
jgi:predicted NBD/HSP70 family sugar kinase